MRTVLLFLVALTVSSAVAEKPTIERYQSIIDRQMFGPLPPGFDPTKSPSEQRGGLSEKELTQEQQKLQSAIHFSVLNVTGDGQVEVGFTDNTDPKAPRHYFLKVGESRDGWLVKEADPDAATMTIAKDNIEVTLSLGGNSAKDAAATKAAAAAPVAPAASAAAGLRRLGPLGGSLRTRRQLRQQEADAAAAEQAAKEAEREARAEQERLQREQERAEQRQQLQAIQEELKRVREQKAAEKPSENGDAENNPE